MTKEMAVYGDLGGGDPVAPPTGDRPDSTLSPVAGATGPLCFQGSCCKFEEKNYTKGLSPYGRATGGYFWNNSKRTYFFEIFIFFKYKKEKTAGNSLANTTVGALSPVACRSGPSTFAEEATAFAQGLGTVLGSRPCTGSLLFSFPP